MVNKRTEGQNYINIMINKFVHGGMVNSAETAIEIGAAVLKGHYGQGELLKQQPLKATDQGETWLVEGSYQEPGRLPGTHSWYAVVQKLDARIIKLGHCLPMDIPDEVKAIVAKAKKDREGPGEA